MNMKCIFYFIFLLARIQADGFVSLNMKVSESSFLDLELKALGFKSSLNLSGPLSVLMRKIKHFLRSSCALSPLFLLLLGPNCLRLRRGGVFRYIWCNVNKDSIKTQ